MYSDNQVLQYLERIHYREFSETSLENLVELQKCHLQHIPYENLDLMNGTALSLDHKIFFLKLLNGIGEDSALNCRGHFMNC